MKKIIYILLIALTASVSLSSCTEEEIAPKSEMNGGGLGSDPR